MRVGEARTGSGTDTVLILKEGIENFDRREGVRAAGNEYVFPGSAERAVLSIELEAMESVLGLRNVPLSTSGRDRADCCAERCPESEGMGECREDGSGLTPGGIDRFSSDEVAEDRD